MVENDSESSILNIPDNIEKIRKQWKVEEIIDDIQNYQQKWNQHVLRMPEIRLPRKALQY